MPPRARKWILVRFNVKSRRKLSEDQKIRSTQHFEVIFAEILDGDQMKQKKINLVYCKISRLFHLKTTRGPRNILMRGSMRPVKRGLDSPALRQVYR